MTDKGDSARPQKKQHEQHEEEAQRAPSAPTEPNHVHQDKESQQAKSHHSRQHRATKQLLESKRQQQDPAVPKPPPIDVSSATKGANPFSDTNTRAPPPAFRRPVPSYPSWADKTDSPRLSRTVHDLALFLSSLPLPLHKATPRILARTIARVLSRQKLMPTNIAFDLALLFWRLIINIFFRSIQPRGAWRIPTEGPVIFIGAPHHNQFLDPLLLASEVRRGSGRRVAFLIAEKSIRRRFIGSAARLLQSSEYTWSGGWTVALKLLISIKSCL